MKFTVGDISYESNGKIHIATIINKYRDGSVLAVNTYGVQRVHKAGEFEYSPTSKFKNLKCYSNYLKG